MPINVRWGLGDMNFFNLFYVIIKTKFSNTVFNSTPKKRREKLSPVSIVSFNEADMYISEHVERKRLVGKDIEILRSYAN
jgi:hypothetical protein